MGEFRISDKNSNTLEFIKDCVREKNIFWTYHVNMRIQERSISRETILSSVNTYEIIEEYPQDRELPSYLVYAESDDIVHILFAVDREDENVRIVTAYHPDPDGWGNDFKNRRD